MNLNFVFLCINGKNETVKRLRSSQNFFLEIFFFTRLIFSENVCIGYLLNSHTVVNHHADVE